MFIRKRNNFFVGIIVTMVVVIIIMKVAPTLLEAWLKPETYRKFLDFLYGLFSNES